MACIQRFALKCGLFFLATLIVVAFWNGVAAAEEKSEISVSSASGVDGETVEVFLSLKGIQNLPGVEGISGGELELTYDPALVEVKDIKRGSIIDNTFTFLPNYNFSENSAKIIWASGSGLVKDDGELFIITFHLKQAGTVSPTLNNLSLYDQDVQGILVQHPVNNEGDKSGDTQAEDTVKGKDGGSAITLSTSDSEPEYEQSQGEGNGAGSPCGDDGSIAQKEAGDAGATGLDGKQSFSGEDLTGSRGQDNSSRITPILFTFVLLALGGGGFYFYKKVQPNTRKSG